LLQFILNHLRQIFLTMQKGDGREKISVPYSQGNNLFSPNVRPCKEQREVFAQMSFFSALKLSLMNL